VLWLFASISQKNDDIGFINRELRLRNDSRRIAFFLAQFEAAGVDQRAGMAPDVAIGIQAVARRAGDIFHHGNALPHQAIKQSTLSDVRAANNGNERFRHGALV
jgi:hypothetical protein